MKTEQELTPQETDFFGQARPSAGYVGLEPGVRSSRRRRARRRSRVMIVLLVLALGAGAIWAGASLVGSRGTSGGKGPGVAAGGAQTTYLMMIRNDADLSRRSDMLALFGLGRGGRNPVTLLIPASALAEIPGHGLDQAGRGFSFGSMTLQNLVVDNMLGIAIDNSVAMTDLVIIKMVDQLQGLDIDVASPLSIEREGALITKFEPGTQRMDGAKVRDYLLFQAADETELSRLARSQQVWEALIERWGDLGAGALAQRFRQLGRDYRTGLETGLQPLDLAEFFTAFAAAGPDQRAYVTLPVTPVSAGDSQPALRIDEDAVKALTRQYFAGSVPASPYRGTRLEVLNGNGVPQIGEKVGLKLIPSGFRFVVNRNARSFDVERTRIIVYDRDEKSLGAARKIRELLGVGEIQIGPRSQSLVDVTVVVGHDFG